MALEPDGNGNYGTDDGVDDDGADGNDDGYQWHRADQDR